jgi:hypothetical protein
MKLLKRLIITTTAIGLSVQPIKITNAQNIEPKFCSGDEEMPSSSFRTVKLDRFGVEVDIPSNYRTMLRQDNSVEILDPGTFSIFQCTVQGGLGGGGYYGERLKIIPRDSSISFQEQAILSMGHSNIEIQSYTWNGLPSYLVIDSIPNWGAQMLVLLPGEEEILVISAGCDCDVNADDVLKLAQRVRPLD